MTDLPETDALIDLTHNNMGNMLYPSDAIRRDFACWLPIFIEVSGPVDRMMEPINFFSSPQSISLTDLTNHDE